MARTRTPTPEALGKPRPRASRQVVTFRLDDPEHDALLMLSERAGLGHSAFARRIVEAYINEHAPTKTPRNRGRRQ
jgi:hypothetical protein